MPALLYGPYSTMHVTSPDKRNGRSAL